MTGGRLTEGVVRVGETVRRPSSDASEFIADLLALLEVRGFEGAPRHLGLDDLGRDTFTFIEGSVRGFERWADAQVAAAGRLLRGFHDATRGSALAADRSVVCHHDPGPNNTIFQDEEPIAFIDFDMAAPGEPLEDVGYMAWTWCVSSKQSAPEAERQASQVRLLVDAYGLDADLRSDVVDAILDRQARNVEFWRRFLDLPCPGVASREQVESRIEWSQLERRYVSANRPVFEAALSHGH
nr:aminoglycoside phosphotransferase family protein [Kribbella solani]